MSQIPVAHKRSIRKRVIYRVTALIAVAILFITLTVLMIVYRQMSEQMQILLQQRTESVAQRLEQRLEYLVENAVLLTDNELMINALIDAEGRARYLPLLVENFMSGKDVVSLSVVDFDGVPIFKTQEDIPRYNTSAQLRTALAMGKMAMYVHESIDQIVLVAPIEYYMTTQGAIVVVFDLGALVRAHVPMEEGSYLKLIKQGRQLYSSLELSSHDYLQFYVEPAQARFLTQLGIGIEMGTDASLLMAPIEETLLRLLLIGLLFIVAGVVVATVLANSITFPIIELYRRVHASDLSKNLLCSPIGTDDELEALAKAFDAKTLLLQYQAEHDALTDLPNRVLFLDRLEQSVRFALREQSAFAILFVDLDHFKEVNDSMGHSVGDLLLKEVALQFQSIVRRSDTIARMGGDEFTLLIDRIASEHTVMDVIEKIMRLFVDPYEIAAHRLYITCSIGVALFPQNGQTPQLLLQNADAAMYRAKAEGRNTYAFYSEEMTEMAIRRLHLQTQLRRALERAEFEVYYQPQVDMRSGTIIGMEALLRWSSEELGSVSPALFIPLAEETGLIVDIDRWVMREAMLQWVRWINAGLKPGVLSLNLSLIQFKRDDFVLYVARMLEECHFEAAWLQLEVTETQIMNNPERTIESLHALKALHIALAIDDFGTGHSSLSYLKRLPVDKIKIDQSFVRDLPDDHDDMVLTRAIIAMAKSLGLEVLAEGVETRAQQEFLNAHHCYEAQGYLFYRPMRVAQITPLLTSGAAV
ncbi:MAG: EAL domain-containing protein [Campylobacterales bacterium]|nr:EAL domain-containing protein [Campylobacterales bacterium]